MHRKELKGKSSFSYFQLRSLTILVSLTVSLAEPSLAQMGPASNPKHLVGPVHEMLKDIFKRLGAQIDHHLVFAAQQGDFVVEGAARRARLLLQNAQQLLHNELDFTITSLSKENRELVAAVEKAVTVIDNARSSAFELEDLVALDLQDLLNFAIPLQEDRYYLRKVLGYSQAIKSSGSYNFELIGNAFGPGFRATITVGDYAVNNQMISTPAQHNLQFQVPQNVLTPLFNERSTVRVPIRIESTTRDGEKVFSIRDEILLFPTHPVKFRLFISQKKDGWSNELTSEGSKSLPRTGKAAYKGEEPSSVGTVNVTVPAGCEIIKEKTQSWYSDPQPSRPGDVPWFRWLSDVEYDPELRSAARTGKHWIHTLDRTIHLKVSYHCREQKIEESEVFLEGSREYLQFGTYFKPLDSSVYVSYRLELEFFDGSTCVLSPSSSDCPFASVAIETAKDFTRMRIDLKPLRGWGR